MLVMLVFLHCLVRPLALLLIVLILLVPLLLVHLLHVLFLIVLLLLILLALLLLPPPSITVLVMLVFLHCLVRDSRH